MTQVRFIGDVHGKITEYLKVRGGGPSLQVGDMGIGFRGVNLPDSKRHRFIRGNHDNPSICREHRNYLDDYGFIKRWNLFYLGGAFSIDHDYRQAVEKILGTKIWWADEELWEPELQDAIDLYRKVKPRTVVSHECPTSVSKYLLGELEIGFRPEKQIITRTGEALERAFRTWQPEIWLFGHYHIDRTFEMRGTQFTCLSELTCRDLEL